MDGFQQASNHQAAFVFEKPLAVRSSECRELIDLARERDLVFTVAENTRFVDAYLATQRVLEQGSLGAIRTIRTLIYGSEVARVRAGAGWVGLKEAAGGGVILDAGVHSFYLLEWLFAPVVEVRASMATLIEGNEVEDNAVVTGRLENGALFTCELTCTAEIPWGERLEVCGEHRTLIVDQLTNPVAKVFAGGEDFAGAQLDGVPFDPRGWKDTSIAAGVVDFVRAVRDRRPTGVDPEAGYHAVVVAERAYESVGTGGTTVGVSASVTAP